MLVAILLIKLETPGSPIYRQKRVGVNGKVFTLYKLRTMYRDADNRKFRTDRDDERVTAVGSFLRDRKSMRSPSSLM